MVGYAPANKTDESKALISRYIGSQRSKHPMPKSSAANTKCYTYDTGKA